MHKSVVVYIVLFAFSSSAEDIRVSDPQETSLSTGTKDIELAKKSYGQLELANETSPANIWTDVKLYVLVAVAAYIVYYIAFKRTFLQTTTRNQSSVPRSNSNRTSQEPIDTIRREPTTPNEDRITDIQSSEPNTSNGDRPTDNQSSEPTTPNEDRPTGNQSSEPSTPNEDRPTGNQSSEPTTPNEDRPTGNQSSEQTTSNGDEPTDNQSSEPNTSNGDRPTGNQSSEQTTSNGDRTTVPEPSEDPTIRNEPTLEPAVASSEVFAVRSSEPRTCAASVFTADSSSGMTLRLSGNGCSASNILDGTSCEVACPDHHSISSDTPTVCENGNWNPGPSDYSCTPHAQCDKSVFHDRQLTLTGTDCDGDTVASGVECTVGCGDGYQFEAMDTAPNPITCNDGGWIHSPSNYICIKTCDKSIFGHHVVLYKGAEVDHPHCRNPNVPSGSRCSIACANGGELHLNGSAMSNTVSTECAAGQWQGDAGSYYCSTASVNDKCDTSLLGDHVVLYEGADQIGRRCHDADDPRADVPSGSHCRVACSNGGEISNKDEIECGSNGQWQNIPGSYYCSAERHNGQCATSSFTDRTFRSRTRHGELHTFSLMLMTESAYVNHNEQYEVRCSEGYVQLQGDYCETDEYEVRCVNGLWDPSPTKFSCFTMDIGVFDYHDSVGSEYLASATPMDSHIVESMISSLNGDQQAKFESSNEEILTSNQRAALIKYIDSEEALAPEQDFKLSLSVKKLASLIGDEAVARLESLHPEYTEIKVRRTKPTAMYINFHTDYALRTLQVPLVGDSEYSGGRLVFAQRGQIAVPDRPAGSYTIHDNTIVHGVTAHTEGLRYGLFLLNNRNS